MAKQTPETGEARAGESAAVAEGLPAPQRMIDFHGTLFGSTLAKVFSALDSMAVGAVLAVRTNDP